MHVVMFPSRFTATFAFTNHIVCLSRRLFGNGLHKYQYSMKTAYFRHVSGEQQLYINFRYTNDEFGIDRDFNFCRNVDEKVTTCLDRMKSNIEKEFNKKSKKISKKKIKSPTEDVARTSVVPAITVNLTERNEKCCDISFNELIARNDNLANVTLEVVNQSYQVGFNIPWVETVTLPTSILAGFFVYPSKLQLLFADKKHTKLIWYRGLWPKSDKEEDIQWEKVGEDSIYETRREDVGYRIKVQCIPANRSTSGPSAEYISKCNVEAGPGVCPFENRHLFTKEKLSNNEFRVVSYNLLADLYADSDYTRTELFPYCPPYALSIDYRKQLFMKEIIGYNADIICLQEVDAKIFDLDLEPIFDIYDYNGVLQKKGNSGEGIATFYNRTRFELLQSHGINIGENLPTNQIFKDLWDRIQCNKKLAQRIIHRSTAVQVNVLKSKDTANLLLVANTHLYFHPDADHIRLLQAGFSMLYVEDIYNKVVQEVNDQAVNVSIIFCGDFNSVPECGIYKLMTEKYVADNFIDWSSNEEEQVREVNLVQPFNIKSACGTPKYTNFTVGFRACLDYIFYQTDNLCVKEIIPFPSDEELNAHIAIPSVVFPSDHIALVADLKWSESR